MYENIFVSELGTTKHRFHRYHFCRGNSSTRKTRIGIILGGSGTYIYLNKRLCVRAGDAVFIPENICCYSEWHGDPEIEVVYLSGFLHYERFKFEPQILPVGEDAKNDILQISDLLSAEGEQRLEAYSRFYRLLQSVLPVLQESTVAVDKTLHTAIGYMMDNWDKDFSVAELARYCCVSESTLYHLFSRELGQTPIRFLNSVRINVAIEQLENSNRSIAAVSALAGFHSENHFRKVFAELVGSTPLKFRKSR